MGKRKRPRYGNPARQAAAERATAGEAFNQAVRRSCPECGAGVEWLTGAEATARGIDLTEALAWLGARDLPGREVWVCTGCDNYGVMDPGDPSRF